MTKKILLISEQLSQDMKAVWLREKGHEVVCSDPDSAKGYATTDRFDSVLYSSVVSGQTVDLIHYLRGQQPNAKIVVYSYENNIAEYRAPLAQTGAVMIAMLKTLQEIEKVLCDNHESTSF